MHSTLIDAHTLAQQLDHSDWVVVDCRFSLMDTNLGENKYKTSHIPNAYYAHLDNDLSSPITSGTGRHPLPDKQAFAKVLARFGVQPRTQIIAYDDKFSGQASRFWWLCQWLGHQACAVLDGGFAAWEQAQLPTSAELPAIEANADPLPIRSALVQLVEHEEIQKAHGPDTNPDASPYLLLDAREPRRYQGLEEPIDRIAGHIPGALNLPFMNNMDAEGKFIKPALLQSIFSKAIPEEKDKTWVHYCGSGVTAAHNILAMTHAGLEPGALYPGSYSQWVTRDAELCPVVGQPD